MSFLLDALRKSEQSGRRRSAPTIHSEAPGNLPTEAGDNDLLPLLAFLLPAFLLMTWLGLQQFETFSGVEGRADRVSSAAVKNPEISVGARSDSPAEPSMDDGVDVSASMASSPGNVNSADKPTSRPRTPVEKLAEDTSQANRQDKQVRAPAKEPVQTPSDPLVEASRAIEDSTASQPGASRQPPVGSQSSSPAARPTPQPAAAQSTEQRYIDFWELPNNIRNQLPELKISVSVFSEQPEERFILVNGQRFYQGDELQTGLILRRVQKDGVIFSYRRYRFMVER